MTDDTVPYDDEDRKFLRSCSPAEITAGYALFRQRLITHDVAACSVPDCDRCFIIRSLKGEL